MAREDKKTDGVEIRISPAKKSELMRAATREGKTASAVVRDLIDGYLYPDAATGMPRSRAPIYGLGIILGIALLFAALALNPAQRAGADELETDISVMVVAAANLQSSAMMNASIRQQLGQPVNVQFTRSQRPLATILQVRQPDLDLTRDGAVWVRVEANEEAIADQLAFTVQLVFVEADTQTQHVVFEETLRGGPGSLSRLDSGNPDIGLISISLRPELAAQD